MPAITFSFQERKYKIYAFVDRQISNTTGDDRLYITVTLRFEGLKGRSVFSGAAIAVPQDWSYYNPGVERNRITKTGVQLALQRAVAEFTNEQSITGRWIGTCYHDIAEAFWKTFLPHIEEL